MSPVARRVVAVAVVVTAVGVAVMLRPLPDGATAGGHAHGSAGPDPVTGVVLLANVVTLVVIAYRSRRRGGRDGAQRRGRSWTYRG
ncbi:hypothetical protein [Phytohabitans houttuyneae]|uniref:Uncharacterized protein n=1 Tax=Phytohabitans houttuyneae TaxID=1076126 RepID=A0A6V8K3C0_9ACTN|nr:hypothetical protein [Phytohabitans houttuyneae]GFJ76861.1 hypothetical protein Phou_010410 [Phytohabitans houttuyneae]